MKKYATKQVSQIRLDEELFIKIKQIAEKELRSMNNQMEAFLIKSVEEYEKRHGAVNIQNGVT